MRRRIVGALVVVLCAAPVAASALTTAEAQAQINAILAQIAQLKEQIRVLNETAVREVATSTVGKPFGTTTPGLSYRHPICGILTRNLTMGHFGNDVTVLQEFLKLHGFLRVNATGYFGPLTSDALSRWQAAQGIGIAGVVGPQTLAYIARWCGGDSLWPVSAQCPQDTKQCPDGSKVGRTGLLCQFTCPADNATSTPACTDEYAPVCASKHVACDTIPCAPVQQTYNNRCKARSEGAIVFYAGECRTSKSVDVDAQCKSWFDGCNTCTRTEPGGQAVCTLSACITGLAIKPRCTDIFQKTGTLPTTTPGFPLQKVR